MGYGYLAPGRSKPRGYASNLLSGYDPLILSPDIWIEARYGLYTDAGITPAEDTDLIYRIADELSGNTNNYDQVTSGKRATLAYVNGVPVIRSTGVNEYYDRGSSLTYVGDFFHSVLFKTDGGDGQIAVNNSGGGQFRANHNAANKVMILVGGNVIYSDSFSNLTTWTVVHVRRIGTTVSFFEGDTPRGGGTSASTHITANYLLGFSSADFLGGDIIAYLSGPSLDDDNLPGLTSYLEALKP